LFLSLVFDYAAIFSYVFLVSFDALFVGVTVFTLKSLRKRSRLMILISEILLFLRHVGTLIHLGDTESSQQMSQFGADLMSHCSFWAYIVGTIIEIALLFEPLYSNTRPRSATQSDFEKTGQMSSSRNNLSNKKTRTPKKDKPPVDDVSEEGVVRKMTTYKKESTKSRIYINP
jgi:uncharacterized membrane protein